MNEIDRVYAKYCRLGFHFDFVVCLFFFKFMCELYFRFHQTILFIDIWQTPGFAMEKESSKFYALEKNNDTNEFPLRRRQHVCDWVCVFRTLDGRFVKRSSVVNFK